MSKTEQLGTDIEAVRMALLNFHKTLIDHSRAAYEIKHGEVKNPGDWVHLLITHQFFSWLHPFSKLITTIDELLEIEMPIREMDGQAVRAEVENLIGDFPTTPKDFRQNFLHFVQNEPSVVMELAKLKVLLKKLPTFEPEKMGDLLNVRQQWAAATKLKHFRTDKKTSN